MDISSLADHCPVFAYIEKHDSLSGVGQALGSMLNPSGGKQASLQEVAGAFEQIMLESMVKEMRSTVQTSELFGSSLGGGQFREFLDSLYVGLAVERGSLGLGEALLEQLEGLISQDKEAEAEEVQAT